MGWTFFNRFSLDMLLEHLLKPKQYTNAVTHRVLAHTRTKEGDGYVLWTVNELTDPDAPVKKFIGCDLLQCVDREWGYKDLCECEYPSYYSCPVKYLDMVPVSCQEWRDEVLKYHEQKKAQRKKQRNERKARKAV